MKEIDSEPEDDFDDEDLRAEPADLSEMTLGMIRRQVAGLNQNDTADDVAATVAMVHSLAEAAERLKREVSERAIQWIEHHGPLQVGAVRYFVGRRTVTKCTNVLSAVEMLLDACGGDVDAVCKCLASQPLKHGACRTILTAEQWQQVFRVTEVVDLVNGKPSLHLRADNGFIQRMLPSDNSSGNSSEPRHDPT